MVFAKAGRGLLSALVLSAAPALAQDDPAAACLDRSQELEAQIAACTTALDVVTDPIRRGDLLAERSRAHRLLGDLAAARTDIEAALAASPLDADPVIDQAYLIEQEQGTEAAVPVMARAYELEPDYGRAAVGYLDILAESGRVQECLDLAPRAIELAPENHLSWVNRGRCLTQFGQDEEALADFRRADGILPDDPYILDNMALALGKLGRWDESLAAAQRAAELDPMNPSPHISVVEALVGLGRHDEAVAAYRAARAAGVPDELGFAGTTAWALYEAGQHELALPIIEDWMAANPQPTADDALDVDTYAHVLAALGRGGEAVDAFLRAAEAGGPDFAADYELRLKALGFATEGGLRPALEACVATGAACRLFQ
jgi:tetratricopeptide (TPR) repeat protein